MNSPSTARSSFPSVTNRLPTLSGVTYTGVYPERSRRNGNGLRVRKCAPNCTSPTSRTVYIFSGSKVIAEYDNGAAPGSPTREYAYSGGALLAKFEAGATSYYHPDHLSNRVITDSAGIAAGTRGHYPYGENWYESGTTTKLKFTTYERDPESGNDFAMARYHVNRLARFNAPDPLAGSAADPQSINRYAYVGNNPVNLTDPSGLWCQQATYTHNGVSEDWGTQCFPDYGGGATGFSVNSGRLQLPGLLGRQHRDMRDQLGGLPPDIPNPTFAPPTPLDTRQPCPPTPQFPPGESVDRNIALAENVRSIWGRFGAAIWFSQKVGPGKQWDYKTRGLAKYEAAGNFNYGATGYAVGLGNLTLLNAAGIVQDPRARNPQWGKPGPLWDPFSGTGSFGDDPRDQDWIKIGFAYYEARKQDCIPVQ